jgi:hypothetical protein
MRTRASAYRASRSIVTRWRSEMRQWTPARWAYEIMATASVLLFAAVVWRIV